MLKNFVEGKYINIIYIIYITVKIVFITTLQICLDYAAHGSSEFKKIYQLNL